MDSVIQVNMTWHTYLPSKHDTPVIPSLVVSYLPSKHDTTRDGIRGLDWSVLEKGWSMISITFCICSNLVAKFMAFRSTLTYPKKKWLSTRVIQYRSRGFGYHVCLFFVCGMNERYSQIVLYYPRATGSTTAQLEFHSSISTSMQSNSPYWI